MKEKYTKGFKPERLTSFKLTLIFVIAIALVCGLLYLFNRSMFNRSNIYDSDLLSPEFVSAVLCVFVTLLSLACAVILKCIYKKKVRIWALLLAALLTPGICFPINAVAFDKGGFLYPLIEDGGLLHFIVIGDYNFDGMNDKEHHILYDEREESSRYGGHYDDAVIRYIDTNATGVGSGLNGCFCFYDWEERIIQLFLARDSVKLKQVEINVAFRDESFADDVSFYIDGRKLDHTVNGFGQISIVFNAEECYDLQKGLDGVNRYVPIKYVINEGK